jgi:hypothetical protein
LLRCIAFVVCHLRVSPSARATLLHNSSVVRFADLSRNGPWPIAASMNWDQHQQCQNAERVVFYRKCSNCLRSQWRKQMKKYLVATAAVLAAALVMPGGANAGASASTPSNQGNKQQAARQTYPISEYSSSTRHHPPKH